MPDSDSAARRAGPTISGAEGSASHRLAYRPEIDGLRAVAVIPVLLFHAGFEAFSGGFVGVDVFFVISGYLITTIIDAEIRSSRFSVKRFYERRARRILPALLTVCLVCVPFAWMWLSPSEYKDFSQSLVAVTVFASNFLFWREIGYFEPAVELKPLLHTWSLAVEEQFYLFFPLLLLAIRKLRSNAAFAIIATGSVLSLALAVYGSRTDPVANFYLIPSRAWELGVGALLALTPGLSQRVHRAAAPVGSMIGLLLIMWSIATFDKETPFPSLYALLPVLGTALLIICSGREVYVGRLLRTRLAVGIGLISYSLYLWHQPILAFLRIRTAYEPPLSAIWASLALALVLAAVSWKLVESPFRRREVVATRAVWTAAAAGSLLVASIGLAGHLTGGFKDATPERAYAARLSERLEKNRGLDSICDKTFTLAPECRTGTDPELAIWGDSFAAHLVDAVLASRPDASIIQLTNSWCGPVLDLAPVNAEYPETWAKGCLRFNQQVLDWIRANPSVRYAILASSFTQYANPAASVYTERGALRGDWRLAAEKFIATLDLLESNGVIPVVVSPPPSFGGDIGKCLFRARMLELASDACDFPESEYRMHRADMIRLLQEIDKHHRVIWLDEAMCDGTHCAAAWEETLLYVDRGHLSHEGSAEVGRRVRLYDVIERGEQADAP